MKFLFCFLQFNYWDILQRDRHKPKSPRLKKCRREEELRREGLHQLNMNRRPYSFDNDGKDREHMLLNLVLKRI